MQESLSELMSSRICHDLISPVGAIGNGLELMTALTGPSPELELVGQSAHTAAAKLKFFRLAFGASGGSLIGGAEAQRIAAEMFTGGRLEITFTAPWGDRERRLVKTFYLLLLCVESSLPRGGVITCAPTTSGWEITVSAPPVKAPADLWAHVTDGAAIAPVSAKTIQFTLARQCLLAQGITLTAELSEARLALSF